MKMIEVDSKSKSRLEILSNLAKIQESFSHLLRYLFEMPRHPLHHRESSGVALGDRLMYLRQDWPGESTKYLR